MDSGEFMLMKKITHNQRRWVTKMRMLVQIQSTNTTKDLGDDMFIHLIETMTASTSKEYAMCGWSLKKTSEG
jgi:hypothetical protein